MKIHPTAIVHPEAQLAKGVEVQPFSIIGAGVRIGAGTVVGPHCILDGDTIIGEGNRFASGAQIGILTQDLKHNPELPGKTLIGHRNVIREYATITASTMQTANQPGRVTSVGDDNLIMCYVHIGHDCHIGNHCIIASYSGLSGHVDVHDYANIAGMAALHQETRVGTHAFVGGMSRVTMDCVPYMITAGIPPHVSAPNTIGMERRGLSPELRAHVKEMYRIMFRSKLNTTQALAEIERSVDDSPERRCFVDFVRSSVRGISK
jgi:UDP-N-acetylglucosamine acyltransferase